MRKEQKGFASVNVTISIPEIQDFQYEQNSIKLQDILVLGKKGYIIVLKTNN